MTLSFSPFFLISGEGNLLVSSFFPEKEETPFFFSSSASLVLAGMSSIYSLFRWRVFSLKGLSPLSQSFPRVHGTLDTHSPPFFLFFFFREEMIFLREGDTFPPFLTSELRGRRARGFSSRRAMS